MTRARDNADISSETFSLRDDDNNSIVTINTNGDADCRIDFNASRSSAGNLSHRFSSQDGSDVFADLNSNGRFRLKSEGGTSSKVDVQQGSAKAWARGTPSAFSDSYNFSTFTDNGVGDYTFSFTNNMNNNTWSPTTAGITTAARMINASNQQTSSTDIDGFSSSGSRIDTATGVAIHGDLA